MRVEQLGETLLEKGSPPDPLPKPFNDFSATGAKLPSLKSVREFRIESLRKNTPKRVPTVTRQVCHNKCGFIAVCTSYNCGVLLKVLSLISLLNPHHFFVIWVKDPNGEKEIKVLGVGFGDETE